MLKRIKTVEVLPELKLRVRFDDGRVVLYDVSEDVREDVREIPSYSPLESVVGLFSQVQLDQSRTCVFWNDGIDLPRGLFSQVQLDQSRTCVFWNDGIDLPSDAIYEYGRELAPAS